MYVRENYLSNNQYMQIISFKHEVTYISQLARDDVVVKEVYLIMLTSVYILA